MRHVPIPKAQLTFDWFSKNISTVLTVCMAIASIVIATNAEVAELLQYDRSAISAGQWWRLLTGHLTHWNKDHLFWNVLMFAVLGAMIKNGQQWRAIVLGSAIAISAVLWFCYPEIETYRGLSGIDTALFVVAIAELLKRALHKRDWLIAGLTSSAALGLFVKLAYEATTGHCLFVNDSNAGFVPLVAAHVVGSLAGAVLLLIVHFTNASRQRSLRLAKTAFQP